MNPKQELVPPSFIHRIFRSTRVSVAVFVAFLTLVGILGYFSMSPPEDVCRWIHSKRGTEVLLLRENEELVCRRVDAPIYTVNGTSTFIVYGQRCELSSETMVVNPLSLMESTDEVGTISPFQVELDGNNEIVTIECINHGDQP